MNDSAEFRVGESRPNALHSRLGIQIWKFLEANRNDSQGI